MKKLINYTIIAFFATIAIVTAAPEKDKAIAREKEAWQTFKDKKADEFRKMLAPDFRGVYAEDIDNTEKQMADLRKMELKSFELSDFDVQFPDADTAVVTYKVTMQFAMDGKEHGGTYNSGSVWKKSKGAWQVLYHSNVEQEKPAAQ
jgi:hypothetical protein